MSPPSHSPRGAGGLMWAALPYGLLWGACKEEEATLSLGMRRRRGCGWNRGWFRDSADAGEALGRCYLGRPLQNERGDDPGDPSGGRHPRRGHSTARREPCMGDFLWLQTEARQPPTPSL